MARSNRRRTRPAEEEDNNNNNNNNSNNQERSVAAHVRDRQRAVAEREASRLARPEQRRTKRLKHADKTKSAVSSTPFGITSRKRNTNNDDTDIDTATNTTSEWCGPWSVARQMIAQREEAKKQRLLELEESKQENHPMDALMKEHEVELNQKAHPSLAWKGSFSLIQSQLPASTYAKRKRRADLHRTIRTVPSLFQLCVDFVVQHFEHVESLGDVGNDIRVSISKELVSKNKLDAAAFAALVDPDMETLELVDCSGIPQSVMAEMVQAMPGLRYLLLTHAGRAFGPQTIQALMRPSLPQLCCLSIAGAYLFRDADAAQLIRHFHSSLQSIALDTCPLLGNACIQAISEFEPNHLLELSLKELPLMTRESLIILANHASSCLQGVKSLILNSLAGLTDEIVNQLLQNIDSGGDATSSSLESLDLSYNHELGEGFLSGIRQNGGASLKSLTLNGLQDFSAEALEALFLHDPSISGLPKPPHLRLLHVADCHYQAITDECLQMVTAAGRRTVEEDEKTSSKTLSYRQISTMTGMGLTHLNVQGSTLVTDAMLEGLVESSAHTLVDLNVSYCPLITDKGLGYLVSKAGPQLSKIHVWGCAQLSDEFFEGHNRVHDQSLEMLGVWMKKSGTRSLR